MDLKNTLPSVPTRKLRGKAYVTQRGEWKNSSESPPGFSSPLDCVSQVLGELPHS